MGKFTSQLLGIFETAFTGAYDTRKCHDAIADRGAHSVIPPRKNAKPWKTVTAGALARNEALRAPGILAGPFGEDGVDTTAGAAPRRRCIVSNFWASG